jgi:hypothetical protein
MRPAMQVAAGDLYALHGRGHAYASPDGKRAVRHEQAKRLCPLRLTMNILALWTPTADTPLPGSSIPAPFIRIMSSVPLSPLLLSTVRSIHRRSAFGGKP